MFPNLQPASLNGAFSVSSKPCVFRATIKAGTKAGSIVAVLIRRTWPAPQHPHRAAHQRAAGNNDVHIRASGTA